MINKFHSWSIPVEIYIYIYIFFFSYIHQKISIRMFTTKFFVIAPSRTQPKCSTVQWVKVTKSCPALCNPVNYIVYGIVQARILEWVAIPFCRGSSQLRDRTQVSCLAGGFFNSWAAREAHSTVEWVNKLWHIHMVEYYKQRKWITYHYMWHHDES